MVSLENRKIHVTACYQVNLGLFGTKKSNFSSYLVSIYCIQEKYDIFCFVKAKLPKVYQKHYAMRYISKYSKISYKKNSKKKRIPVKTKWEKTTRKKLIKISTNAATTNQSFFNYLCNKKHQYYTLRTTNTEKNKEKKKKRKKIKKKKCSWSITTKLTN